MTFRLCNPEYYIGTVLKIRKSMEVREEGMEVQEEAAHMFLGYLSYIPKRAPESPFQNEWDVVQEIYGNFSLYHIFFMYTQHNFLNPILFLFFVFFF